MDIAHIEMIHALRLTFVGVVWKGWRRKEVMIDFKIFFFNHLIVQIYMVKVALIVNLYI